ncbi:MAG: type I DNA topoisomerase [Bacilli bacterium]
MKLVIVESPTKCHTIKNYLGENYTVLATKGHVRELATSGKGGLGVDVENGFKPTYKVPSKQESTIKELQEAMKKCDEVILATDPDREGEAIAWHVCEVLDLDINKTKRLEFHEITKEAITEAINNPRTIDMDMVYSQEARRILDRIIGFKLSNLIYRKIKSKSAGRVQTATLKLVCDLDKKIAQFVPEKYYSYEVKVEKDGKEYTLSFDGYDNAKEHLTDENKAKEILTLLDNKVVASSVKKNLVKKAPKLPLSTSDLQQECNIKYGYDAMKTMKIAQTLYEGVKINGEYQGLITYMRTPSRELSTNFTIKAKNYVLTKFGNEFLGKEKLKKEVSPHECIRPHSTSLTPDSIKQFLTNEQYKVYSLIYKRAISSIMSPRVDEVLTVSFEIGKAKFHFEIANTLFQGYEALYKDDDLNKNVLPDYKVGDEFIVTNKQLVEKETTPPNHFNEARLIKAMEEAGIGRPSTYAPTIYLIKNRKYVSNSKNNIVASEQGVKTEHILEKYFPNIINIKYTSSMEEKLDLISEGKIDQNEMLKEFYYPFIEEVEQAYKKIYIDNPIPTGEMCPQCGEPLVYRYSKKGNQFVGCSNFPKCRYIKKEEVQLTGEICPECGSPLCVRKNEKGEKFIGCSSYPKCLYIKTEEKKKEEYTEKDFVKDCPVCGNHMVKKKGKYGYFLECLNYSNCKHREKIIYRKKYNKK